MKVSIRLKIMSGYFIVILIFLIAIGGGYYLQIQSDKLSTQMIEEQTMVSVANDLLQSVSHANTAGAYYMLSSKSEDKSNNMGTYDHDLTQVNVDMQRLILTTTNATDQKNFKDFVRVWNDYTVGNQHAFVGKTVGGPTGGQSDYIAVPFDTVTAPLQTFMNRHDSVITDLQDQVQKNTTMSRVANFTAVGVAIVIAILVGLFISGRITKPLRQVNVQLKDIAEGEGDLTRELSVKSNDEIGSLAQSFNQMIGKLRGLISEVGFHAEQVAAATAELTASAEQTSQSTEHIAVSIQEVAHGSNEQVAQIQEGTVTIHQMRESVSVIADHAKSVSESALQTTDLAKEGNDAIQTAVSQMDTIHTAVQGLDRIVRGLGERSHQIGEIVELISSIAGQTNLLALNAAIEAARAGEYGRGFAVVADEVRKLAEQSSRSAEQIAQLVVAIQEETQQAVDSMESGIREVANGSQSVGTAGASFDRIMQSIALVAEQIEEVSASAQHLSSGAELIVGAYDRIAVISAQAASGTQEVSAATEQQLASMQEIATTSESLSQMAEELQGMVGKFKV